MNKGKHLLFSEFRTADLQNRDAFSMHNSLNLIGRKLQESEGSIKLISRSRIVTVSPLVQTAIPNPPGTLPLAQMRH